MRLRRIKSIVILIAVVGCVSLIQAHLNGPPPGYSGALGAGAAGDPVISIPGDAFTVCAGDLLAFTVSAPDPAGDSWIITISSLPPGASFADNSDGTGTFTWTPDFAQAGLYCVTITMSNGVVVVSEDICIMVLDCAISCLITMAGDVNESGSLTSTDIIWLINFVYKGGVPLFPCYANGDVNCSGNVTSADIVYMVGYVFKGESSPCDICDDSPIECF